MRNELCLDYVHLLIAAAHEIRFQSYIFVCKDVYMHACVSFSRIELHWITWQMETHIYVVHTHRTIVQKIYLLHHFHHIIHETNARPDMYCSYACM